MEEYCETSARSRNKLCSSFCNSCATSVASAMASAQWLSHTCRTWQGAPCEVNQKSMNALQLMIEEAVLRLNNIKTLALPSSCFVTDNPGTLAARV